jgi:hypothetical protein
MRVLSGEGVVHRVGSRASEPLAIQVTDETGRPVEGASVNFLLPNDGPSGVFEGGMNTTMTVTDVQGRAAVFGIRWNSLPGPLQIRVTAQKQQARAGMLIAQYLSETGALRPRSSGPGYSVSRSRAKWIVLGALLGGAAGGLTLGLSRRPSSPNSPPAAGPPAPIPVQIGTPSISLGTP